MNRICMCDGCKNEMQVRDTIMLSKNVKVILLSCNICNKVVMEEDKTSQDFWASAR